MTHQQKQTAIVEKIRKECEWLQGKPVALPLPVRYDGMMYFFGKYEKGDAIVADIDMGEEYSDGFRIRGWGRIQYMKEEGKTAEQLQDEVAYYIQDAINAYKTPTLSDLMYVIKSQYKFESNECAVRWKERSIGVFCGSKFPCVLHNGETLQILGMYKLALPLITNLQQSEDLTNFIHELICH